MKTRKASKSKVWCLTCREKPQTLDSDSSDRETEETENNVDNKTEDNKTEKKMENQQEQKNIPAALSKRLPETGFWVI